MSTLFNLIKGNLKFIYGILYCISNCEIELFPYYMNYMNTCDKIF